VTPRRGRDAGDAGPALGLALRVDLLEALVEEPAEVRAHLLVGEVVATRRADRLDG